MCVMNRWVQVVDPVRRLFFTKVDWNSLLSDEIQVEKVKQHNLLEVWEKRMYEGCFTAAIALFDDNQNYFVIQSWVKPRLHSVMESFNGCFSLQQVKRIVTKKVHERYRYHISRRLSNT